jgi:hypothetical protein
MGIVANFENGRYVDIPGMDYAELQNRLMNDAVVMAATADADLVSMESEGFDDAAMTIEPGWMRRNFAETWEIGWKTLDVLAEVSPEQCRAILDAKQRA